MGKKPIVSVTHENERISIKNSLRYLKCVLCQFTLLKMWACIRHVSDSADNLKRIPYTRVSVRFTLGVKWGWQAYTPPQRVFKIAFL